MNLVVVALATALPCALPAQETTSASARERRALEQRAQAAEAAAADQSASEAERHQRFAEGLLLRQRLREGDFQVGDRVIVQLLGDSVLSDTFTVASGLVLPLPPIGDLSLMGVLRSELKERVQTHLARFYRNPSVETVALVRVGILGQVGAPGYYFVPSDVLLADVLMRAGGLTRGADVHRTVIRRSGDELFRAKEVDAAIRLGRTVDQTGIRAGDEIVVGEIKRRNWSTVVQSGVLLAGLVFTLVTASS